MSVLTQWSGPRDPTDTGAEGPGEGTGGRSRDDETEEPGVSRTCVKCGRDAEEGTLEE